MTHLGAEDFLWKWDLGSKTDFENANETPMSEQKQPDVIDIFDESINRGAFL